jgi:hypothetical protein
MTDIVIPNTFQNRELSAPLKELDENFQYLATVLTSGTGAIIFDGGSPTTTYTGSPVLDCGGVT